jgi:diketogulonate reductase-like aldo/keto reductase
VHSSDLDRSDVFLETKIWISDYGYAETLYGFEKSACSLRGRSARSASANFMVEHLRTLLDRANVVPAVNQIEVHPSFAQRDVQRFGAEHGLVTQAWSPIGGITFYRDGNHGSTLDDPVIGAIAKTHSKSPAQVMLRWGLQHGRSVIPKSTKPSRIAENIDVFDFELSAEEMSSIDGLDTGRRGGPEPEAITIGAFGREIPES